MRNREVTPFLPVQDAFPEASVHKTLLEAQGIKVASDYFIDLPPTAPVTPGKSMENFEALVGHMVQPLTDGKMSDNQYLLGSKKARMIHNTSNLSFFTYHGGVKTVEEMGKDAITSERPHGISYQAIQQKIAREFEGLMYRIPENVRENFPKESLDTGRRDRLDIFLHGINNKTLAAFKRARDGRGTVHFEDLRREFPDVNLNDLRQGLEPFGLSELIPLSRIYRSEMGLGLAKQDWINLQRVDADNFEVQEALDNLGKNILRSWNKASFPVVFLSDLLREAEVHVRQAKGRGDYNLVLETLQDAQIPLKIINKEVKLGKQQGAIQRYALSGINQRNRIIEVLQTDPRLSALRHDRSGSVKR